VSKRTIIVAAIVLVAGGAAVAVFGAPKRREHPHPAGSSSHGSGIDHQMSAMLAMYHAPEGATSCESAYNAFKYSQDWAAEKDVAPVVEWLAPRDEFLAKCAGLSPQVQQCMVPRYLSEHRSKECGGQKPPDDVFRSMVVLKGRGEPGSRGGAPQDPDEPPPLATP